MRTRFGDRIDHVAAFFGLELVQFFLQEFGAVFGQWNVFMCLFLYEVVPKVKTTEPRGASRANSVVWTLVLLGRLV